MESWFHNETVEYGQASTYRASAVVIRMWKKRGVVFRNPRGKCFTVSSWCTSDSIERKMVAAAIVGKLTGTTYGFHYIFTKLPLTNGPICTCNLFPCARNIHGSLLVKVEFERGGKIFVNAKNRCCVVAFRANKFF